MSLCGYVGILRFGIPLLSVSISSVPWPDFVFVCFQDEFEFVDDEPDVDAAKARAMRQRMRMVARQVAMNPDDGIDL